MMKRLMTGAGLAALLATSAMTSSAMAQSYSSGWGTGNVLAAPGRPENEQLMGPSGSSESFASAPRERYAPRHGYDRAPRGYVHEHVMEGHSDVAPQ